MSLVATLLYVDDEVLIGKAVARLCQTLGRPVLQKAFDFADLERSIEDAERSDGT